MKASLLPSRLASLSASTLLGIAVLGLGPLLAWAMANEEWLLAIMLGGLIFAPFLIRWPVISTIGLYAFLIPFDGVARIGGGATLTRLIGIAAGGTLLVTGLMERRLHRPPAAALWWTLLVLWGAMTAMWAIEPDFVMSRMRTALSLLVLYLVAVSFEVTRKEMTWVCALTISGGIAAAMAAYFVGMDNPDLHGRATVVVADKAANANAFAGALLVPMALAVGMFMAARRPSIRIVAVGAIAAIGVGIGISISRGAILSLGVLVLVIVYRLGIRWHFVIVGLVLVGLLGVMPEAFFTRIAAPVSGEDASGAGRTDIWLVGLQALEDFWVFGAGLQNFVEAYARYVVIGPQDYARGAHNIYLGTWVELGILGLLLMIAAIGSHFVAAWRLRRGVMRNALVYATEAGCVAILAHSFFGDRLWLKDFWMGWILLAWSVRLARQESVPLEPETEAEEFGRIPA